MALLDGAGDIPAFVGEHKAAVFFVIEVAQFAEFLDHAGHRSLLDVQGQSDVDDSSVTLLLDQLMDTFEVVFSALGWHNWGGLAGGIKQVAGDQSKCRQGAAFGKDLKKRL